MMHPAKLTADAFVAQTMAEMQIAKGHRDLSIVRDVPAPRFDQQRARIKLEMPLDVATNFVARKHLSGFSRETVKLCCLSL
jgi:hypothetical protein